MTTVAFIGAGRMAGAHASALSTLPGVRIAAVHDPSAPAAEAFAKRQPGIAIRSSVAEIATDPAIDAVLVCNYSDQHHQTLCTLLDAGRKRIFCEKALVTRLEDGEDLLRRAAKADALIMVGHHRRHIAGFAALRNLVLGGRLGRVRMAKVAYCHPGYARQWGDFFADFARSGGVTLDMMSHVFDQLNWSLGAPVEACGRSVMFDRSQPLPMDYVSATVTYAGGVICNIDGSWQRYGTPSDRLEIYGDEACAIYDGGDKIMLHRPNERTEIGCAGPSPHVAQMQAFLRMVDDGVPPVNGLAEGFQSVRVALGVLAAATSGTTFRF